MVKVYITKHALTQGIIGPVDAQRADGLGSRYVYVGQHAYLMNTEAFLNERAAINDANSRRAHALGRLQRDITRLSRLTF